MIWQWLIVAILVGAAAFYIARLLVRTFKTPGCTACASQSKTMKLLKKLAKKKEV